MSNPRFMLGGSLDLWIVDLVPGPGVELLRHLQTKPEAFRLHLSTLRTAV